MTAARYLFLGGSGLIGGEVARQIAARGDEVWIADLRPPADGSFQHLERDVLQPGHLQGLLAEVRPDCIVNTINVATIFSHDLSEGYRRTVSFYAELYEGLRDLRKPLRYLQVGTTGAGGLGFDIPFTHGERAEDMPIVHKAAFAGITTSLLTLISRSFPDGSVRVSELKPGLSIFSEQICVEDRDGVALVTLDGGESGAYTAEELEALTRHMGFTTVRQVAERAVAIFTGEMAVGDPTRYDVTAALNRSILASDEKDQAVLENLLEEMRALEGEGRHIVATGNLGPPEITLDILRYPEGVEPSQQEDAQADTDVTLEYLKSVRPELHGYLVSRLS